MTTPDLPSRSHAERMESAARTYERFVPGAEPERVAASMARRYGPLGTFAAETVGAMWDRPGSSWAQERSSTCWDRSAIRPG